jgi:hypothetical protein
MTPLIVLVWPKSTKPLDYFRAPLKGPHCDFAKNASLPNRILSKTIRKAIAPAFVICPTIAMDTLNDEQAVGGLGRIGGRAGIAQPE